MDNKLKDMKCCQKIFEKMGWYNYPCNRTAKVLVDGKPFCGIHDPNKRKEKDEERNRKYKEYWDKKNTRK